MPKRNPAPSVLGLWPLGLEKKGAPSGAPLSRPSPRSVARTSAPAARALGARTRLVDRERTAAKLGSVQRQGLPRLLVVGKLDESKPLGLAGVAIGDHAGRVRGAELREHVAQLVVGDVVGEVADI